MPPELLRRFEVVFKPLSKAKPVPMRRIGAEHVGRLVSVKVIYMFLFSILHSNMMSFNDLLTLHQSYCAASVQLRVETFLLSKSTSLHCRASALTSVM